MKCCAPVSTAFQHQCNWLQRLTVEITKSKMFCRFVLSATSNPIKSHNAITLKAKPKNRRCRMWKNGLTRTHMRCKESNGFCLQCAVRSYFKNKQEFELSNRFSQFGPCKYNTFRLAQRQMQIYSFWTQLRRQQNDDTLDTALKWKTQIKCEMKMLEHFQRCS